MEPGSPELPQAHCHVSGRQVSLLSVDILCSPPTSSLPLPSLPPSLSLFLPFFFPLPFFLPSSSLRQALTTLPRLVSNRQSRSLRLPSSYRCSPAPPYPWLQRSILTFELGLRTCFIEQLLAKYYGTEREFRARQAPVPRLRTPKLSRERHSKQHITESNVGRDVNSPGWTTPRQGPQNCFIPSISSLVRH